MIKTIAKNQTKNSLLKPFLAAGARSAESEGRGGNSLPLQSLSFPLRPSGLGFCETPAAFRSKKVRAFSIIAHN
jgi:hypothetical protein